MGLRSSKLRSQLIGARGVRSLICPATRGVRRLICPPTTTPRGYVPVCVGVDGDTKRFMVHTELLGHAEFLDLLYRSVEEYGFCNDGVLRIPYEVKDFEEYWMIKKSKPKIYKLEPI